MHELFIATSAKKSVRKLSKDLRQRIFEQASPLKLNPYLGEKLTGNISFLYSLHFNHHGTSYRIAYEIDNHLKRIIIHLVGVREGFYQRLKRMFR